MIFKPKTKGKWRKDATIKIKTLLDITENPKGCFSPKPRLIQVEVDKSFVNQSTCFPATKKGKKELLKYIRETLK